ncbi:MAG TPA: Sec-independent protein translocase protein TatB [Steroidobacteraceae bacterium]|nr:Sec-independent protein translocase protein TatB [Steroidobacteraceae bacterium]
MFDIGFSEILVIFVLALIVLGPEKLPRVVREVGRWVGRARAMARQFQEQLEAEVDVDRGRTIRPEPVRPVGGVPAAPSPPPNAEPSDPVSSLTPPWQISAEPLAEATASSGEPSPEPLTPGTHERGT